MKIKKLDLAFKISVALGILFFVAAVAFGFAGIWSSGHLRNQLGQSAGLCGVLTVCLLVAAMMISVAHDEVVNLERHRLEARPPEEFGPPVAPNEPFFPTRRYEGQGGRTED